MCWIAAGWLDGFTRVYTGQTVIVVYHEHQKRNFVLGSISLVGNPWFAELDLGLDLL